MTAEERFERELPSLLADLYPMSAPDYRHDLVQQFAATRQRPAWTFPERWIPVNALVLRRGLRPLPWRTIGLIALVLVAVIAGAIVAGSQRRLPPPFGPAANGDLVTSEGGDVFLIDPDTGAKTLAIGGPATDSEAAFSLDGTRIAFFRDTDDARSLWVAGEHGEGARQLSTSGLADISQIEWSPDGTSILVTTLRNGRSAPAIVPVDGGAPHVVEVDMPAESPIWLPSGEILFRGVGLDGFGLFAVRPDGTGDRTIVPVASRNADDQYDVLFYAPSPDATQVAYQLRDTDGTQKIFVVAIDGGTSRVLTSIESVGPLWSPDGKWIAFFAEAAGLQVIPADGSGSPRQVASGSPEGLPAAWTPDSKHILYLEANGSPVLVDPLDGSATETSWTATSLPDWQRLAGAR